MKIGSSAENTLVTNVQDTNRSKFKIQATGKAFSILSNALYQHKVKAVVREIGCNAYDAHIDAGTTGTPFHVTLPCKEDPHFTVRDFGIGLAEDKFVDIYTTYFGSSKADSNDHTGGLGLGSKTPFIMSKSFTVHSFYNGTDYMWHSFVNDNGEPDVMMLHAKPTTEPNGLKVIVPIGQGMGDTEKVALFRDFRVEAEAIYQWFDVIPQVTVNAVPVVIKPKLDTAKYTPLKLSRNDDITVHYWNEQAKEAQGHNILVKMGNVVYPYDLKSVRNLDRFGGNIVHTQNIINYVTGFGRLNSTNHPIVIEVGMGDVDIAPSREALSLNNTTELTIINSIVRFTNIFFDSVQNQIDNAKTVYEKYQSLYLVPPMAGRKFSIDGKEVDPYKQTPTWIFGTAQDTAGHRDRMLRWFDSDGLVIKYRRANTRGLLPLKTSFNMEMYGPSIRSRTIILVDTVYKGELRQWVNANVQHDAAVVVVFGEDFRGNKIVPRPLTADEMVPFLEDGHPQVVLFSKLKHSPALQTRATTTRISAKVTNEDIILLNSTNSSYNYFTAGNSSQIKLKSILDEFDPKDTAPIVYIAMQKKGDKVFGEVRKRDPKASGTEFAEMGYWSRAQGNWTNWQAGTDMLFAVTRTLPNRLGITSKQIQLGVDKNGDPQMRTLSINNPVNTRQVLMSKESYDACVDKPEYPHVYSVDRYLREVILPMIPTDVTVTRIDNNDALAVKTGGGNGAVRDFCQALNLTDLLLAMTDIRDRSMQDTSFAVNQVKDTFMFRDRGYCNLVNATIVTNTYNFPWNLFINACKANATKANMELHDWLVMAGPSPFNHFVAGGYNSNTQATVQLIGQWLRKHLMQHGFNGKAFSADVLRYIESIKVVS